MLVDELLAQVKALRKEDSLMQFRALRHDPDPGEHAFDPIGLRTNYEAANMLMRMLEEENAKTPLEADKWLAFGIRPGIPFREAQCPG